MNLYSFRSQINDENKVEFLLTRLQKDIDFRIRGDTYKVLRKLGKSEIKNLTELACPNHELFYDSIFLLSFSLFKLCYLDIAIVYFINTISR